MSEPAHKNTQELTLDGHPDDDRLRAFALGRLSGVELDQVAEHLAGCDDCRARVESAPADPFVERLRGTPRGSAASRLRVHAGYELLKLIGQGGMAVVHQARQVELGRVVALKQIKGAVGADDLARFRAEASAMARLQHPNIVQVYDVGEQDERPYIACEFVSGGGLDRWLTGEPLAVETACRWVATIARAVQFAHDRDVIHRDLKPSNILLQRSEFPNPKSEKGEESDDFTSSSSFVIDPSSFIPKVADFGLAKLLDQDDGCTRTGAVVGTPAYMAPEQAGGRSGEIGTRTDIYALGVILYETLTGRRPFQGTTVIETLDLVRSAEPVPPRRWRPSLARDLDVICLTCLAKEPQRRYATAAALADDLEAFLAGKPIRARPVPAWERSMKWARRHPARAALVLVCALAAMGLVAGTTWHNQRLRGEVERANRSEREALVNFRHGYDALDQLIDEAGRSSAQTPAWRQFMERIATQSLGFYYGALQDADESRSDVRMARAMLLTFAGGIHVSLGRFEKGLDDLDQARTRLEGLRDQDPANDEIRYHLAHCYYWTALANFSHGQPEHAEESYRLAIQLETDLVASGAEFPRLRRRLALSHDALGWMFVQTRRLGPAVAQYEVGLAQRRKLAAEKPTDDENRTKLAEECDILAWCHIALARAESSEPYLHEAEAVLSPRDGALRSPWNRVTRASIHRTWGTLETMRDDGVSALAHFDVAAAELDELLLQEPTYDTTERLMDILGLKHATLTRLGRAEEAPAAWDAVIAHSMGARRDLFRSQRALTFAKIGDVAAATSEADELAARPGLAADALVPLAIVYSLAIEATARQSPVGDGARQTMTRYASRSLACLQRADAALRTGPTNEPSAPPSPRDGPDGEIRATAARESGERTRLVQASIEIAERLLASDCQDEAEACLQLAEAISPSATGQANRLALARLRAECCRRRAFAEISQGHVEAGLEQLGRGIALLGYFERLPENVEAELHLLWRHKAWWLSREARSDEAFAAWDQAVTHSPGAQRDFCRSERALERALVGDHQAAAAEADEIAAQIEVPGHQCVHLARVYSRSIEALERDSRLRAGDMTALKAEYAASAVLCLRRAEGDWLTGPERLGELDSDAQLSALRDTPDFQEWRKAFTP
ncbi:MAG TPA: protein kinase [Pirellulales bacterium]|nr:protein kinase [Pirellulales bacterium]